MNYKAFTTLAVTFAVTFSTCFSAFAQNAKGSARYADTAANSKIASDLLEIMELKDNVVKLRLTMAKEGAKVVGTATLTSAGIFIGNKNVSKLILEILNRSSQRNILLSVFSKASLVAIAYYATIKASIDTVDNINEFKKIHEDLAVTEQKLAVLERSYKDILNN